jgi:hypothetical protein
MMNKSRAILLEAIEHTELACDSCGHPACAALHRIRETLVIAASFEQHEYNDTRALNIALASLEYCSSLETCNHGSCNAALALYYTLSHFLKPKG